MRIKKRMGEGKDGGGKGRDGGEERVEESKRREGEWEGAAKGCKKEERIEGMGERREKCKDKREEG